MNITLGSLFDGIGGFPYAGTFLGITPIWASEIEPWPIKVTEKHFPNMKHLGDITKINGAEIEPVDIITFGSPCQDLSVAGKREGLSGARSGLFMEAVRIIREMRTATDGQYPRFAVWENVPGAFSSNGGEDIKVVLDEIEGLGFVVDLNVLDAQYMGVPQRRRRIFALCQSVDFIRQMMTPTSWSIITQLLTEILLCILNEALNLYEKEPKGSVWRQRKLTADGLQRKMKLFSIEARKDFEKLLTDWAGICQIHLKEQSYLVDPSEKSDITIKTDTFKNEFLMGMEPEELFGSILKSWKELLDVLYDQENSCITLTVTNETMNQIIYGCATLLENTALLIAQLKNSCQNSYETELYISTARKVCIDYARERQAGITLFSGMEWVQCWDDYIRLHTETTEQFERYFGGQSAGEILFIEEGLRGDIAESREAREEAAGDAGNGIKTAGGNDVTATLTASYGTKWNGNSGADTGDNFVLSGVKGTFKGLAEKIAGTLGSHYYKGPGMRAGTERTFVASYWDGGQISDCLDCSMLAKGQMMPEKRRFPAVVLADHALDTLGNHAVAVDCRNLCENEELSATIQSKSNGGYSLNYQNPVRIGYAVRRLAPLECLRLQGFPDYWLDIEGMSDSAKYKAIGNSVAIPCVKFVLGGIARVLQI